MILIRSDIEVCMSVSSEKKIMEDKNVMIRGMLEWYFP